ncbi:hypothetical protein BDP27DRAFT_1327108 [Rhodocollybia butyracea]|uniref:Transmembrane protein n=1 Tax=Rhodocollybia butyracea TaxID=206335 RepID=A0A9P5PMF0_9AGAR|nr:hypothetical protein BDP27DRAFT_1327108 [Rhodocollybia butyracea]
MSNLTQSYLLAGSWLNMLFYGTEIVLGALLIDTVCTAVVCYNAYFYIVLSPESLESFIQPWTLPVTILCTYHAAVVEQVFFIRRFWQITRNKLVTFLSCFLLIAHISFAWILVIDLLAVSAVTVFNLNLTIIAASLCAATDLFIAVVMFHTMSRIKTTYTATQSLLRRISMQSMACGFTTSATTVVMLALLVTHNLQPFTVIFDILGRLYTLTILFNYLVLRKPLANVTDPSGVPTTIERSQPIIFGPMSTSQAFTVPTMELTSINTSFHDTSSVNRASIEGSHSKVHTLDSSVGTSKQNFYQTSS